MVSIISAPSRWRAVPSNSPSSSAPTAAPDAERGGGGRPGRRRRSSGPQARRTTTRRAPSPPRAARPAPPGSCHFAGGGASGLTARGRGVPCGARSAGARVAYRLPRDRLLRPGRPPPPRRRGRLETPAHHRRSVPRHPRRQGRQPRARPPRRGLGRAISCARADDAAGRAARTRLRAAKLAQASPGRARAGSVLVGRVVFRVAERAAATRVAVFAGGDRAHLARTVGVAAVWADRRARGTTRHREERGTRATRRGTATLH